VPLEFYFTFVLCRCSFNSPLWCVVVVLFHLCVVPLEFYSTKVK
jgi:hypothetical protein